MINPKLPSLEQIDNYILNKDKPGNSCPWCGGKNWSTLPKISTIPKLTLTQKEDLSIDGSTILTPNDTTHIVAVRCSDCGYVHLFDYLYIINKMSEQNG